MRSAEPADWLVVGLNEQGARDPGHRLNVGAMVLDAIAWDLGVRFARELGRCDVAEHQRDSGERVVLARPRTLMGLSGAAVAELARSRRVPADRVLVVHDELDLPFSVFRLKRGGGEGGHHGLRSITEALGSREYCRMRFGIGRPPAGTAPADFVAADFTPFEQGHLRSLITRAEDAVLLALRSGLEEAQNRRNGRGPMVLPAP